ncbi:sensor histidine kinase [Anaerosporobacter sp.]|uniref:sensor histidine kinase n=1 Tax=Anaerosporobacter sp. TaxID=1872529 RepID=UPI00286EF227|nr:histidine kinase [Anaerosporobacter sp.]
MFKKLKPAQIFLFAIILTAIFTAFTFSKYNKSGEHLDKYETQEFGEPQIYVDGVAYEGEIALPMQIDCEMNGVVTLKNTIPVSDLEYYSLCFRSRQQFVKVYVDGEEIYSYGYKEERLTKAPTSAWQSVQLKKSYEGKEIIIQLSSPYAKYSGAISEIIYCNRCDYQSYLIKRYMPGFVVSCVIISLGGFILMVFLLTVALRKVFWALFYIGICTILMGSWSLGESRIVQFMYGNLDIILMTTLLSLTLALYPYILFMRELIEDAHKKYLDVIVAINAMNFIRCITLALLQRRDLIETIDSVLILSVVCIIIVHVILIHEFFRSKEKKNKLYTAAYLAMTGMLLMFAFLEVIAYYLNAFREYGLFLRIGILLYMAVLTLTVVTRYLDLITEANDLREKLLQSQVTLMLSQIQPHFLYNTLTAIRTLIKRKPDEAYKLVGHFSRYLRTNLNSINGKELIPFAEELNHIRTYVNIELVRFNNQFEVSYDIDIEDFLVPPLSIQPIVENAIKHGICKMIEGGVVTIRTRQIGESIIIEVIDNGVGFDVTQYETDGEENGDSNYTSVGIKNIKMRLTNICKASFKIRSREGFGTMVTVVLPKKALPLS